jgi:hypothetical protein
MLDELTKRFNIEQLIRYILIGVVDAGFILLYVAMQKHACAHRHTCAHSVLTEYLELLQVHAKVFLYSPALGFVHYLSHRFVFFVFFDNVSYILGKAPWAVTVPDWETRLLMVVMFWSHGDHDDKAEYVRFRNDIPPDPAPKAAWPTYDKRISSSLSRYLFLRWAYVHFTVMFLESILVFFVVGRQWVWVVRVLITIVVVVWYGGVPLHLYEKKYYEEYRHSKGL